MAKTDGLVTRDKVTVFKRIFHIAKENETYVARIFNLAHQDIIGYESHARSVQKIFKNHPLILQNIIDGLFHIALADEYYHPNENNFIAKVTKIFEIDGANFCNLRNHFAPDRTVNAYEALSIHPDVLMHEIRHALHAIVRFNHPDRLNAQGLPQEAIVLASKHLITANKMWKILSKNAPNKL